MKFSFNHSSGLIVIESLIQGRTDDLFLSLAIDTAANRTVISIEAADKVGFDIKNESQLYELATGSGKIFVPQIVLPKIYALGVVKANFSVFVHSLPSSAGIDGVLGLDFLRGHILMLDFKTGEIGFE